MAATIPTAGRRTYATVAAITRPDLQAFYQALLLPQERHAGDLGRFRQRADESASGEAVRRLEGGTARGPAVSESYRQGSRGNVSRGEDRRDADVFHGWTPGRGVSRQGLSGARDTGGYLGRRLSQPADGDCAHQDGQRLQHFGELGARATIIPGCFKSRAARRRRPLWIRFRWF